MPDEPELPEAVVLLHPTERPRLHFAPDELVVLDGEDTVPLYTRAQLTAHAEAVAAVRVREALDQAAEYLVWESKAKGLPLDHEWVRGVWVSAAHLSGLATEQVAHD